MVLEWIANPSVGVIRLPSSSLGLSAKVLFPCSSAVEQLAVNQLVGSSILPEGAKFRSCHIVGIIPACLVGYRGSIPRRIANFIPV